ncbi:unnamed protein product, partial [Amoebophrya sp. A120]|eukprot:GSA120T00010626001.1
MLPGSLPPPPRRTSGTMVGALGNRRRSNEIMEMIENEQQQSTLRKKVRQVDPWDNDLVQICTSNFISTCNNVDIHKNKDDTVWRVSSAGAPGGAGSSPSTGGKNQAKKLEVHQKSETKMKHEQQMLNNKLGSTPTASSPGANASLSSPSGKTAAAVGHHQQQFLASSPANPSAPPGAGSSREINAPGPLHHQQQPLLVLPCGLRDFYTIQLKKRPKHKVMISVRTTVETVLIRPNEIQFPVHESCTASKEKASSRHQKMVSEGEKSSGRGADHFDLHRGPQQPASPRLRGSGSGTCTSPSGANNQQSLLSPRSVSSLVSQFSASSQASCNGDEEVEREDYATSPCVKNIEMKAHHDEGITAEHQHRYNNSTQQVKELDLAWSQPRQLTVDAFYVDIGTKQLNLLHYISSKDPAFDAVSFQITIHVADREGGSLIAFGSHFSANANQGGPNASGAGGVVNALSSSSVGGKNTASSAATVYPVVSVSTSAGKKKLRTFDASLLPQQQAAATNNSGAAATQQGQLVQQGVFLTGVDTKDPLSATSPRKAFGPRSQMNQQAAPRIPEFHPFAGSNVPRTLVHIASGPKHSVCCCNAGGVHSFGLLALNEKGAASGAVPAAGATGPAGAVVKAGAHSNSLEANLQNCALKLGRFIPSAREIAENSNVEQASSNIVAQLGPVLSLAHAAVIEVSCGISHSLALDSSGIAYFFGDMMAAPAVAAQQGSG